MSAQPQLQPQPAERRLILWDVGGVLNLLQLEEWQRELARLLRTTKYKIMEFLYLDNAIEYDMSFFEKIEIDGKKWSLVHIYETFLRHFKVSPKDVSLAEFQDVFCKFIKASPLLPELKSIFYWLREYGIEQGILSNINVIHAEYVERFLTEHRIDEYFPLAHRFYSCHVRVRKSETPLAFLTACKSSGVQPKNACLIDDLTANIRGAIRGKGKGILYLDPKSTREQLIELGFLP